MKTVVIAALLVVLVPIVAFGQTYVTVDPAAINLGFMNVYNLPADGGAFQFGSGWGFADLTGVYAGNELTLGPNTIGDPNEYWYQCIGLPGQVPPDCGVPGAPGNKIMEANGYAEVTGTYAGQTLNFSGVVLSNTLTSAHTVVAFIKDFAGDYSSFNIATVPLSGAGAFSVELATVNDPTRHVQYGFQMVGVNVWVTDVGPYGTIVIGPTPPVGTEDSTWGKIKSLYQ